MTKYKVVFRSEYVYFEEAKSKKEALEMASEELGNYIDFSYDFNNQDGVSNYEAKVYKIKGD